MTSTPFSERVSAMLSKVPKADMDAFMAAAAKGQTPVSLLTEVDAFLRRTQMPQSTFGRKAIGDPRLLNDMRNGRELRTKTQQRIRDFMEAHNG